MYNQRSVEEVEGHITDLLDELEVSAIEEYIMYGAFKDDALDYAQTQGWSAPEDSEED